MRNDMSNGGSMSDAKELVDKIRAECYTHSNGGDYSGESRFDVDDCADIIAAHDAAIRAECAERAVRYVRSLNSDSRDLWDEQDDDNLRAIITRAEGEG